MCVFVCCLGWGCSGDTPAPIEAQDKDPWWEMRLLELVSSYTLAWWLFILRKVVMFGGKHLEVIDVKTTWKVNSPSNIMFYSRGTEKDEGASVLNCGGILWSLTTRISNDWNDWFQFGQGWRTKENSRPTCLSNDTSSDQVEQWAEQISVIYSPKGNVVRLP